jgi:signal transduction histidine kinase
MFRLIAPFARYETYGVLLFQLAGLLLGTVAFAVLITGWTLVVVFAITPLVVPMLIGVGEATRLLAAAERVLARELLGERLEPPARPPATGFWSRGFIVLTDRATWKAQAYLLLRLLVAFPVLALLWWAVEGIAAPLTYRWGWPDYDFWRPDTQSEAFLVFAGGFVLLLVTVHLASPLKRLSRWLAVRLLAGEGAPALSAVELRRRRRRTLAAHAVLNVTVGALLVVIWALTTSGYFWPVWPLLALGLVLGVHAWVVYAAETHGSPGRFGGTRGLAVHAGVSILVTLFLVGVWAASGQGYFWPIWPALGLGALLGLHAAAVFAASAHEERIEELETTRAGAVDVHEDELRRIERDLHDGAQASLVSLGINLGMAQQKLETDPSAAADLLAQARRGAQEALEELRDLARGIHPPVLGDRGLEAAVAGLASRSPVHVTLSAHLSERPPAAVETAAYFVVAEAIANAGKHADADSIEITIRRTGGMLVVDVADDGHGGADANGHGLTGLRQRVAALDGTLEVTSPPGGPTKVRARIPCGS